MSGKSRSRKGKHLHQGKKRAEVRSLPATVAQHEAEAQTRELVSQPGVSAPPAGISTPMAKLAASRYPHVAVELRTIGILVGIILVILILLALFLP